MAKRKTKTVYFTPEPDWKKYEGTTDQDAMNKAYQDVQYFVRTEIKDKDKIAMTRKWVKDDSGWAQEDIVTILKSPDWVFGPTSTTIYSWKKLNFISDKILEHLEKRREEWIYQGGRVIEEKLAKAEKAPKKVVSIQERMKEQVADLCGDLEGFLDDMVDGEKNIKEFDPFKAMQIYQPEIKGPHAKIIKDEFAPGYSEALEVLDWKDEDLKEAYEHFDVKMRKAFVQYYETINTACDTIIKTKATTRKARKPKARSKDAIVKKLKFQVNDPQFALASLPATDVVYANEVWVYNTKTRKIGVYKAKDIDPKGLDRPGTGIMVKGTTLTEFNPKESIQKTLRKPAEMLPWFEAGKQKCKKSFDTLTTTPTKMNGRFNEHTIILKTF